VRSTAVQNLLNSCGASMECSAPRSFGLEGREANGSRLTASKATVWRRTAVAYGERVEF
jgi:hypothetical protein